MLRELIQEYNKSRNFYTGMYSALPLCHDAQPATVINRCDEKLYSNIWYNRKNQFDPNFNCNSLKSLFDDVCHFKTVLFCFLDALENHYVNVCEVFEGEDCPYCNYIKTYFGKMEDLYSDIKSLIKKIEKEMNNSN
jgi:hypothetical protein